jgi:subtilisin family serine protease
MRQHFLRNSLCLLAGMFCSALALAAPPQADGFIVHFERGGRFAASTPTVSHWVRSDVAVVRPTVRRFTADAASLEAEMAAWRKLPGVRLVEPDVLGHFDSLADVAVPNDPLYTQQTWLGVVGARTLWALGSGCGVTVAVIDSGIDLTHPDLQPNLIAGYDFADKDAVPQDVVGHGTFVAGLLAAASNNGIGGSGLAPGVRIMPLKTSPDSGSAPLSSAVAQSIDYAVANGADIINLSLTIDTEVELVRQSVQAALAKGVIIVAAAGNAGGAVEFPANMAGVVAVANTQSDGTLAGTSNRGPEIAIAAPGANPVSTLLGGGYGVRGSGTSYASPMAAAAVAALHAANPNLSLSALLSLLQSTATPVSGYSFGVLQAGKAAAALVPDLVPAKTQFASQDSMSVTYRLPATGTAYDIYIAVTTPLGEISLRGDGSWQAVASDGYARLVAAVPSGAAQSGLLFGSGGSYPAIPLAGLPAGSYTWRIALLDSAKQSLLGTVVSSPFTINP